MKLMYLLALVFIVNVVLVAVLPIEGTINSLFTFLQNPFDWNGNPLSANIAGILGASAFVIFVGSLIFKNTDLLWYGVAGIFLSFGSPLVELWSYVQTSVGGDMGTFIAQMFISPLILAYILMVIYFAKSRD